MLVRPALGYGWTEARRLGRGAQHVGWGGARSLRSAATKPNTFIYPSLLGFAALNANLPRPIVHRV